MGDVWELNEWRRKCKGKECFKKLGRVMGMVQIKQVAVNLSWKLERIGK